MKHKLKFSGTNENDRYVMDSTRIEFIDALVFPKETSRLNLIFNPFLH